MSKINEADLVVQWADFQHALNEVSSFVAACLLGFALVLILVKW